MSQEARRILAIETSSRTGSAALATETAVLASARLSGQMRHAGEFMPTVNMLLKKQGWPADTLTDVFVSIGPGSFTGLRIAVSVARTLAWSIGVRIVAVPTVDVLACNALDAQPVPVNLAVVLDAKREQVYAAAFELQSGTYEKVIDAHLAEPGPFLERCLKPLAVLGEGISYHQRAIDESRVAVLDQSLWVPRAEHVYHIGMQIARAGRYTPGGELLPLYIRRPEAEEKWEKLHGPQDRKW